MAKASAARLVERLETEVGLSFPDGPPTRAHHQRTGQESRTFLKAERGARSGRSRLDEYLRWRHASDPAGFARDEPIELYGTVAELCAAASLVVFRHDGDWHVADAAVLAKGKAEGFLWPTARFPPAP